MNSIAKKPLKSPLTNRIYQNKTTWHNCRPHSRCNNHRECEHCKISWRKNWFTRTTKHLTEDLINKFKYKYYLVVTSHSLEKDVREKNADVNLFIKSFISKKRNKNFVIDKDTEFLAIKENSHSVPNGYNPHFNIIVLTNKKLDENNKQFVQQKISNDVDVYVEELYKSNDSYLNSIHKIINYSCKFDIHSASLERDINLMKNEQDIFRSSLFSYEKYTKLQELLYIHIQEKKDIKTSINKKIKEAKKIFKRNSNKKTPKKYIRMLKSYHKKIKLLKKARTRSLKCLAKHFRAKKSHFRIYD